MSKGIYADLIENAFESEERKETPELSSKLYVKENAFGKKLYFFTSIENEYKIIKLKKDFSNVDEVKDLEPWEMRKIIEGDREHLIFVQQEKVVKGETEVKELPPGFYTIGYSQDYGYYFIEQEQSTGDKYLELGGGFGDIRKIIDEFYTKEKVYRDLGMLHKLGILLYGAAGNGKTSLIRELCKNYKKEAVVIFVEDALPTGLIKQLKYFPANYIFVLEELTHILNSQEDLAQMLNFLDGEYSLDRQLVIGTTNYPEALPENLASRPSRFDKLIKVDNPDEETRRTYLASLLKSDDIDEVVKETKDMSIAYLKEIVISSKIAGTDIMEAIKENKKRIKIVKEQFATKSGGTIGFN